MERGGRVFRDLCDESWELPGCVADGGVEEVETGSVDFYWQGTRFIMIYTSLSSTDILVK